VTVVQSWFLNRTVLVFGAAALLLLGACTSSKPTVETNHQAVSESTPTATIASEGTETPSTPQGTIQATPTKPIETQEPTAEPEPYDGELVSMRLPSLGVEAPIERIGLVPGRNQLDVPQPLNVGWYEIYDKPGFGTSSLFSAHKDYYPNIRGPFYSLKDLENGDQIVVVMDDGREYVYEVFFQRRYTRENIPVGYLIRPHEHEDPEMRRPSNEEWIVLYTCGGDFVARTEGGAGYYLHRDVVIARLIETILPPRVSATENRN